MLDRGAERVCGDGLRGMKRIGVASGWKGVFRTNPLNEAQLNLNERVGLNSSVLS